MAGTPETVACVSEDGERAAAVASELDAASDRFEVAAAPPDDAVAAAERVAAVVVTGADEAALDVVERVDGVAPCIVAPTDGSERLAAAAVRAGATDYVPLADDDAVDALADSVAGVIDERGRDGPDGQSTDTGRRSPGTGHVTEVGDLYEATRELLLAETPERIAEIAADTVRSTMGLEITTVFEYDRDASVLVPVASTDAAEELFGGIPDLSIDSSLAGEVFRRGEYAVYDDVREAETVHDPETPIRAEILIPLGDYGVLVSGATEPKAFGDAEVYATRVLGSAVEAALDRVERERELEDYETVFTTVQDRVYVLDERRRFRMVNDPLCDLVGYDREELLGRSIDSLLPDEDEIAHVRSELAERIAADGDPTITVETEVRTADGETIPVEADVAAIVEDGAFAGSVGVVRDISDRKRVRAELEHERSRRSVLFENIPDAVVRVEFVDGRPIVRAINPSFESEFGYEAAELVGEPLNNYIVPEERREQSHRLDDRAREGEVQQTEVRRQTADGVRSFLFRGVPVSFEGGDVTEGFGIYTDITDQKTRERRLQVLNRVLRHNLRNEMNVVLANAQLLRGDDPDLERRADEIERTAREVADMGEKVRRIQTTIEQRNEGEVDVGDVIEEVLDPYQSREDVRIVTDFPDVPQANVGEVLRIAVQELVENAIEHRETAPTRISATASHEDEEWIDVAVADDGPGIPEEEIAVLTGDSEITQLDHGSGLGLWLVNWLVTGAGGDVSFSNEDGSVVTLRLPAADGAGN